MNETDLARYIDKNNIKAEIITLNQQTPTVNDAASAVGAPVEQIGKSILFVAEESPMLVIANGNTRISYKKLAQILGINRRKIKIAKPDQVLVFTGYPVGTVPPFGHIKPIDTFVDIAVMDQPILFAGGGSIKTLLRIETGEVIRASKAKIAALSEG